MPFGFFSGIKKELLAVASQPKNLVMITLFPLITILAFGGLYSNTIKQSFSLAVFVDENNLKSSAGDLSNPMNYQVDFFSELEKTKNIMVLRAESEESLRNMLMRNEADSGIVISRYGQKEPYSVTLLVDGTDFGQSTIVKGTMSYHINSMTTNISVAIIKKIYERLLSQEAITTSQLERLDQFLAEFQKTKQVTKEIESRLDTVDTVSINSLVQGQKAQLQAMKQNIASARAYNEQVEKNYVNVDALLFGAGLKWIDSNGYTRYYNSGVTNLEQSLMTHDESVRRSVQYQKPYLDSLEKSTDNLILASEKLDQNMHSTEAYLASFRTFLGQAKDAQTKIETDLMQSRGLLAEVNGTIKNLKQYSPEFLAKPTVLNFGDVVSMPNMATQFFPIVMSLVIMFTAMLLASLSVISEKKQGILSRLRTMPVHKSIVILEKAFGLLIVTTLMLLAMVFIGVLAFGIQLNGNILGAGLAFVFISWCFITFGLAIGAIMNNESSTILTILTIAFPMIFLSGLLIPVELMPSGFLVFKIINPLAASSTIIANSAIKGISFIHSLVETFILALGSLLALLAAYIKYW